MRRRLSSDRWGLMVVILVLYIGISVRTGYLNHPHSIVLISIMALSIVFIVLQHFMSQK